MRDSFVISNTSFVLATGEIKTTTSIHPTTITNICYTYCFSLIGLWENVFDEFVMII